MDVLRNVAREALLTSERIVASQNQADFHESQKLHTEWCHGRIEPSTSLKQCLSSTSLDQGGRVRICAYSLASHPMNIWQARFEQAASLGLDVRLLLPDPSTPTFLRRCFAASVDPTDIFAWFRLLTRLPSVSVRLFAGPLDFSVTIVQDTAFLRPYLPNKNGNFSPIVVLKPQDAMFKECNAFFDSLWTEAKPVSVSELPSWTTLRHSAFNLARILAHDEQLRHEVILAKYVRHAKVNRRAELLHLVQLVQGQSNLLASDSLPDVAIGLLLSYLRPAVPVRAGLPLSDTLPCETWRARLGALSPAVISAMSAVGLIELENQPQGEQYAGTGWLVGPDVLVTSARNALVFATAHEERYEFKRHPTTSAQVRAVVNFGCEPEGGQEASAFDVLRVLFISATLDVAFLRLASAAINGDALPPPIQIARPANVEPVGQLVLCVGYSSCKACRLTKQLRPGRICRLQAGEGKRWLAHDCAITSWHSGSVVLNLATGQAEGLQTAVSPGDSYAIAAHIIPSLLPTQHA